MVGTFGAQDGMSAIKVIPIREAEKNYRGGMQLQILEEPVHAYSIFTGAMYAWVQVKTKKMSPL